MQRFRFFVVSVLSLCPAATGASGAVVGVFDFVSLCPPFRGWAAACPERACGIHGKESEMTKLHATLGRICLMLGLLFGLAACATQGEPLPGSEFIGGD